MKFYLPITVLSLVGKAYAFVPTHLHSNPLVVFASGRGFGLSSSQTTDPIEKPGAAPTDKVIVLENADAVGMSKNSIMT